MGPLPHTLWGPCLTLHGFPHPHTPWVPSHPTGPHPHTPQDPTLTPRGTPPPTPRTSPRGTPSSHLVGPHPCTLRASPCATPRTLASRGNPPSCGRRRDDVAPRDPPSQLVIPQPTPQNSPAHTPGPLPAHPAMNPTLAACWHPVGPHTCNPHSLKALRSPPLSLTFTLTAMLTALAYHPCSPCASPTARRFYVPYCSRCWAHDSNTRSRHQQAGSR